MTLRIKKKKKPTTLAELEESSKKEISDAIKKKREHESDVIDTLDAGFYFSIVFRSRKERDEWLRRAEIELIDDEYVYGSSLNIE